ncbi:MAG: transcription antitermination factor NusB [Gemmatimonadota bacterium]
MTATASREAALQVLGAVRRGVLADRALHRAQAGLAARDRAWVHELSYGALRLRARLDRRIAAVVRRGLEAVEPELLDILRLGAYQLTEMGGVPVWAAVNETVELAKPRGRRAAGFVNGVLKAVSRADREAGFPDPVKDPIGHLVEWGSHPRWLVERWTDRWGLDGTRRLVETNNQRADVFLRPLGIGVAEALERLLAAGMDGEAVGGVNAIRLGPGVAPEAALAAVPAVVQDPAAGLVADCTGPVDGAIVADLCAAPGGKAIALAAGGAGGRPRRVIASDVSARRLRRLRDNAARVGGLALDVVAADARRPAVGCADIVLVDAPCSGTGTFRRHPDARWRLESAGIASLARLQDDLLDGAARIVAPGGLLVYATCTLESEENGDRVTAFLERHGDYEVEPCAGVDPAFIDEGGRLLVLPHEHGFDGAFAARLRRRQ